MRAHRLILVLLVLVALAACAARQRWDDPDRLSATQRIQYEAGEGLLTLIHAVNVATARIDAMRRDGVISAAEYQEFVTFRLDFRAWWQPIYATYVAGGSVAGEEAAFYDWQAKLVDLYLRFKAKRSPA